MIVFAIPLEQLQLPMVPVLIVRMIPILSKFQMEILVFVNPHQFGLKLAINVIVTQLQL